MAIFEHQVCIGVPVYLGGDFLAACLASIAAQTHRNLRVMISIDGGDQGSEAVCEPFLTDARFELHRQPERLGWASNISWLMARNTGTFWYYHQQDDLVAPDYVETLLAEAIAHPGAAITFCDIRAIGLMDATFAQSSVVGSAFNRQMILMDEHLSAVAFRGLVRAEALALAGGVPHNPVDDFLSDTTFMAAAARWGDLRRVPKQLYSKRYHAENTHTKWPFWSEERRVDGWIAHCKSMLDQAFLVETDAYQARLLLLAACERTLQRRLSGGFLPAADFPYERLSAMVMRLVTEMLETQAHDLVSRIELSEKGVVNLVTAYCDARATTSLLDPTKHYRWTLRRFFGLAGRDIRETLASKARG